MYAPVPSVAPGSATGPLNVRNVVLLGAPQPWREAASNRTAIAQQIANRAFRLPMIITSSESSNVREGSVEQSSDLANCED
jgi:hypothetical protein